MMVDETFFERFGSRLDSHQPRCVRGAQWLRSQGWAFPVPYYTVLNEFKRQRKDGLIDPEDAAQWLDWARNLRRNADAIDFYGTAVKGEYELKTHHGAQTFPSMAKAVKGAKTYQRRLRRVTMGAISVAREVRGPRNSLRLVKVNTVDEVTEGAYQVHNPKTGRLERINGLPNDVVKQVKAIAKPRIAKHIAAIQIAQKYTDPDDGFVGWKVLRRGKQ